MSAIISKCGKYRYELRRTWDDGDGQVMWLMLNPSTADGTHNDHTIRRCIRFSQDWGYRSMVVGNLFAYRTKSPELLWAFSKIRNGDIVGPSNDFYLADMADRSKEIILAWGAMNIDKERANAVLDLLKPWIKRWRVLDLARDGAPRHPLMLPANLVPRAYV